MLSWPELREHLITAGFFEVLYTEIFCKQHGDWRLACRSDKARAFVPECPRCRAQCDFALMARGLSRTEIEAVLVSGPVRDKSYRPEPTVTKKAKLNFRRKRPEFLKRAQRELQEGELLDDAPRTGPAVRPSPAAMQQRLFAIAELLHRGIPQAQIAQSVGLSHDHLRVTLCRRRKDIEMVMAALAPNQVLSLIPPGHQPKLANS